METISKTIQWLDQSNTLNNIAIGVYGGGDQQRIHSSLLEIPLPSFKSQYVASLLSSLLPASVASFLQHYQQISSPVSRISPSFDIDRCLLKSTLQISVFPVFEQCDKVNLMFHGWLFYERLVSDSSRLGISSWPLVGLGRPSQGFKLDEGEGVHLNGNVNVNVLSGSRLVPADQHIHWVEEVADFGDGTVMDMSDWHLGSDMARLGIEVGLDAYWGWVYCIDTEQERILITFLILLGTEQAKSFKSLNVRNYQQLLQFGKSVSKELYEEMSTLIEGDVSSADESIHVQDGMNIGREERCDNVIDKDTDRKNNGTVTDKDLNINTSKRDNESSDMEEEIENKKYSESDIKNSENCAGDVDNTYISDENKHIKSNVHTEETVSKIMDIKNTSDTD